MFDKPFGLGWARFNLPGFRESFGWLTNAPVDCLNAFLGVFSDGRTRVVRFDDEGLDYLLVVSHLGCCLLVYRESGVECVPLDREVDDLAEELINDLETHAAEWGQLWCNGAYDGLPLPWRDRIERLRGEISRYRRLLDDVRRRLESPETPEPDDVDYGTVQP